MEVDWIEIKGRKYAKKVINKGWSDDKKYCITDEEGNRFLLRLSPMKSYERKQTEYEFMCQSAALGVPMCKPIEIGILNEAVYSIQSWIEGADAEAYIPDLSREEQYSYGLESGKMLKEIHKIPVPKETEDWESYFNRKANRKIEMYKEGSVKRINGQAFIDYIHAHKHLLHDRPNTYQHGDYHIGNMMIGDDKQLYIIDFDRYDFGDPWEEFNRIVWSAQAAPSFAAGMINGYFDNKVPMVFWELLALYISSNTLGSLAWASTCDEKQMQVMVDQARDVLRWYDDMKNPVPSWYNESTHSVSNYNKKL